MQPLLPDAQTVCGSWELFLNCSHTHRQSAEIHSLADKEISGTPEWINNFDSHLPIDEKIACLLPEFRGTNQLCVEIARRIILARRGVERYENTLFISAAIYQCPLKVFSSLSTRWTLSIMDTLADYAPQPLATAASLLTNFVLGIRLGFTAAHVNLADPQLYGQSKDSISKLNAIRQLRRKEIWNHVIYFNFENGDTYRNYLRRCQRLLRAHTPLYIAYYYILKRLSESPYFDGILTRDEQFRTLLCNMGEEIENG